MTLPALFASDGYDGLRALAAREWSEDAARAVAAGEGAEAARVAWAAMSAADFVGAAVPGALGGSELALSETLELAAGAGSTLLPTSLSFEALLPALVLRGLPTSDRIEEILGGLVRGMGTAVATNARRERGGRLLEFVHGITDATFCLIADSTDRHLYVAENASLRELVALRVLDGRAIGSAYVSDADIELVADGVDAAAPPQARWIGALLAAADAVGAASSALERAVAYASDRSQFGAPIGSFQAIKHALVDRFLDLQVSRALLASASQGAAVDPVAAAMVKEYASGAAVRCVDTAVQVHGAIGFTEELGLHLSQRRVLVDRELFATPGVCLSVVRNALGLQHVADQPSPAVATGGVT